MLHRYDVLPGLLILVLLSVMNISSVAQTEDNIQNKIIINFEDMPLGSIPAGFIVALTGEGNKPVWTVETGDSGATKYLMQTSSETQNYRFPLCIFEDFISKDVDLSVQFKAMSGKIDQAAGLIWRYQDPNNYYIVRANAIESNVVLYKMENGKRSDLKPIGSLFAYGKEARVVRDQWNTLQVVVKGNQFQVRLNNEYLFDVEDKTFTEPGKVGLWTKADSVTSFDDLSITSLD